MTNNWIWPTAGVTSFALTWATIRLADRRLLDFPNERSSHDKPVPRGGGIAVLLTFAAGIAVLSVAGIIESRLIIAMAGGGLIGLIGAVDDVRHVRPSIRLLIHAVAAGWALSWLGGIPGTLLPGVPLVLHNILGLLCIVWLVNLYNFMDGIDGIAGIEAVTVSLGGLLLHVAYGSGDAGWSVPALLLACVAGFLVWNFPSGRVFLGDSGSGFLGFMMAFFCIYAAHVEPALFWAWIILLGVFIADSGVTLARRTGRRERLHEAHRSHAYQHAARKYGAHAPVSLAVGAINVLWLWPLAFAVASGRLTVLPALLIAFVPLIWLAIHFRAGAREL